MGRIVVIPEYLALQIDAALDSAIAKHPDAEADREHLRSQIVEFVDEHGYLPRFDLAKTEPTP